MENHALKSGASGFVKTTVLCECAKIPINK